ncbi:tryptophan dimethylallyltransferase family protein [Amycolatopsis sp. WQ 127309]|uniref:tryptophan dimethylallyltransferase family protein n=1 Tax=Amycolatopsis sp. WQ 127309 TaxID=2932773 RepID=UPI001FF1A5D1|nr:tryptophan dimethylallyltransferase family protein [Amycolatopsis sp. WQ 127309]UOZ06982.1 hypothetical protein MUY22_01415 [Amycolatopsis sp. WQ 127309]
MLSETAGRSGETAARDVELATSLMGNWVNEPVSRLDDHHSFAANDGSPVEFSFAMNRSEVEPRVCFESLDRSSGAPHGLTQHHFVRQLDDVLAVDVSRLRLVEDLFAPGPAGGLFSMLCATAFRADGDPLFKVYLNPATAGEPRQAVGEAMARLGLGAQWAFLEKQLGAGRSPHQEIAFFALDLGASPEARVKLYLRHTGCGPAEFERAAGLAEDYQPDLFTKILGRLYGDAAAGLRKAPMTCLAFQGNRPQPTSATLYCPLDPNLADDAEANARIVDLLEMSGIASDRFDTVSTAISGSHPAGAHRLSWLGYKQPSDPIVTVYAALDGSGQPS